MGGFSLHWDGRSRRTERFLEKAKSLKFYDRLDRYAQEGVIALAKATPKDSGKTANSWGYNIEYTDHSVKVQWTNDNINEGYPIAILLQYGHGTLDGSYVAGKDYINPAMEKVFKKIVEHVWEQVIK